MRDPQGKPIQGVEVTVTSPQSAGYKEVQTTDKKGSFIVDFRQVGVTYHYRFEKTGYQTMETQQAWHLEGTQHYDWTLSPGGGQPGQITAFNEGVAALNAQDYKTAEAKFNQALKQDPKLIPGWRALGTVYLETGRNRQAAEAAEKAIGLGATDETVLRTRWEAYRNLKDETKAAEALKDLQNAARTGEDAKKIHNEAVALEKLGDNAGAFAKFQEALKVDPNLQPAQLGLATAALKLGKYAEAATAAETVLKANPKDEQALRLRYNACLNLGDKVRLFDALLGLYTIEPSVASKGLVLLASEAYDAKELATAKQRSADILKLDDKQPLPHYYLGMIAANEGGIADARTHLERFLALAQSGPEVDAAREVLRQIGKL